MGIVGMEPTEVLSGQHITVVFIGSWVGSQRSPLISKQKIIKTSVSAITTIHLKMEVQLPPKTLCMQHLLKTVDNMLHNIHITR
jgi:hypothetical protein